MNDRLKQILENNEGVEELARIEVQVHTKPDPDGSDAPVLRSNLKVERQDNDAPGQFVLAACITAMQHSLEQLLATYKDMYGEEFEAVIEKLGASPTTVTARDKDGNVQQVQRG